MLQVLIALDQLVNALLFRGWADETISARAYRNADKSKRWLYLMRGINALFFWQKHHCLHAYQSEVVRQHLPPEYRDAIGIIR